MLSGLSSPWRWSSSTLTPWMHETKIDIFHISINNEKAKWSQTDDTLNTCHFRCFRQTPPHSWNNASCSHSAVYYGWNNIPYFLLNRSNTPFSVQYTRADISVRHKASRWSIYTKLLCFAWRTRWRSRLKTDANRSEEEDNEDQEAGRTINQFNHSLHWIYSIVSSTYCFLGCLLLISWIEW